MSKSTLAKNRRAKFDYKLHDHFNAGLILAGHEVKSARLGQIDLKGSYVTMKENEAWLTNAHIKRYQHAASLPDYDPDQPRKLLLSKKELHALQVARDNKYLIVPVRVFTAGKYIKVEIATAKSKKKHDKRVDIKTRDTNRDIARDLKNN